MATYTTLRRGSSGDEVTKYQQTLKDAGYNIDVDGKYGPQTESITKAYQKANGLSVDGIAGNQTLGKLYGGSTATTTPASTTQNNTYKYEDFTYEPFEESDTLNNYNTMLQEMLSSGKPTQQESAYKPLFDDVLNKYMNREEFSYDLNADALYQQYKDQYTVQGQLAMMDAMGKAAAMTGGYVNSYAQSVGHQAYQGYLQQLNDKVPELYQLALSQYNQEGQDLKDQMSMLNTLDQQEYEKYRDTVSDFYTDTQLLADRADTLYDREYATWGDEVSMDYKIHSDNQTAGYQEKTDAYSKATTMIGLGVMPDAATLEMAGITSAEAQAMVKKVNEQAKAAAADDGDDVGDTPGGGYDDGGLSTKSIKYLQKELGVSVDGKVGKNTWAAIKKAGYSSTLEAYKALVGGYTRAVYDLQEMKAAGASNEEASAYIKEMIESGELSSSAWSLYNLYRDNRLG